MNVGIIGAAGYTAGELIRLAVHHPNINLVSAVSQSQNGLAIADVHKDLKGDTDLRFETELSNDVDVLFLCMGHGYSEAYLNEHPGCLNKTIIDLSTDFRPRENNLKFIYGLPEINKKVIQKSNKIANPGCFATAIQLAILPLAQNQLLQSTIHVHAITGSTGAGQKPMPTTHFSWRNNNLSIYKLFEHQHLEEITATLSQLQKGFDQEVLFVPMRGDFPRGIYASVYTECDLDLDELNTLFKEYYQDHPYAIVSENEISLKEVVNTNKCFIKISKHKNRVHISTVIDNLLKGASGQAIQNMNLMMSWPETTGLKLKSIAF